MKKRKDTKRKAFNFLRSYLDVLNRLDNRDDKLDFLLAVINKQFYNEDPESLSVMSDLSYESQRHQIEKSVKGWLRANKTEVMGDPIPNPPLDPMSDIGYDPNSHPSLDPKEVEEEEEEEEEVKEQVQVKEQVRRIREVDDYRKRFIEPNECIQNLLDKKLT